jgi:general secretion pathway protein G
MLKMLERIREAKRNDEDGFTLIELLIVIVILGVLAGIVVFSVQGIQDRGQKASCKADVATVQTAEEAYYASQTGPTAFYSSEAGHPDPKGGSGLATLVNAGFLKSNPTKSDESFNWDDTTHTWSANCPDGTTYTAGS